MSLQIIGEGVTRAIDLFEVIKAPPKNILDVDIIDDTSYKINNLYKKLFQFKYRYVYDDNEKSVWSAVSKIPLPAKSTDSTYNALSNVQNSISIQIPTGEANVYKIEIAGRVNIESEWSDFFLVDTLDKKRDNISSNTIYNYFFKNDSVYTPIDIQESNLLFDYVPDEANALELANGNTLVVGGLKDGYNRDVKLDVVVTNVSNLNSPAVLSTLTSEVRNLNNTGPFTPVDSENIYGRTFYNQHPLGFVKFSGTPQVGDIITITLFGFNSEIWDDGIQIKYTDRRFDGESFQVVFRPGWGIPQLVDAFINHPFNGASPAWNVIGQTARPVRAFFTPTAFTPVPNSLYFGSASVNFFDGRTFIYNAVNVSIKRGYSFGESDVFPTYKWSGLYKFGLVYYSKHGKTNGVFTNPSMMLRTGQYNTDYDWTQQGEDIIIPENETAQLYIGHEPPKWADYYHIVRTKDLSCDFSLMVVSPTTTFSGNLEYMYIDINNIPETATLSKETSQVINYGATSFVPGDRVRILQLYNPGQSEVNWVTKDILDLPILSVETISSRLKIKVKNVDVSSSPNILKPANNEATVIEIYRPAKVLSNEDLVYYEIGYKYDIYTDSSGIRRHGGQSLVDNVVLNQFLITQPSSVYFYNTSKTISISRPSGISGINAGDIIQISGTSSNNGIFNVVSVSTESGGIILNINVLENVIDENIITPNVILSKISNQGKKYTYVSLFNDGDYYFKTRAMVNNTNGTTFGAFFVADKNFAETSPSAVWSQGRPLIVDENIKEEYYPAMLRFSQSYIYGTNINNLSRFYPNNFEEADASFGDILRLKTRENFIRLFQRFKTGMIPIYRQIIIDNAQSSQVALSERLLNKPNYYSGEYGIDKYGSSLISTDYGDYFIDTNNKAIVRVSLDGITNISDTYNLSSWVNSNIKNTSFGYGCFNYENRNVIMLIGNMEPIPNEDDYDLVRNIVAYSESDRKFESFYGFTSAENMLFINGFVYSGFDGKWYIHDSSTRNNFFGSQQSSAMTTVFNGNLQLKKTYTAIEELANGLWTGTITTGPLTNQLSSLDAGDFQKTVGAYVINSKENKFNATIKRDQNSPGGKFQGTSMKGLYAQVALTNSLATEQRLISVSLKYIPSPLTNS